uniref:Uncharacterized protein n=1 Tax=Anguilla anguilla TaxID=7936 RepID=A0A0E9QTC2_ANGAN
MLEQVNFELEPPPTEVGVNLQPAPPPPSKEDSALSHGGAQ